MSDPVVAPTIIRHSMHHGMTNGRIADVIVDVSFDLGTLGSRATNVPLVVAKVRDAWQDKICPHIESPIVFTGLAYTDLDSLDSVGGDYPPNGAKPVNSGTAREVPPPSVAILVTKYCSHSRKQRKGRMYIPGPREDYIDSKGEIGGTYLTGWQAGVDDFRTAVNAIGGTLGFGSSTAWRVVHRHFTPEGVPIGYESSDVTSLIVQARVATQRRRLRG